MAIYNLSSIDKCYAYGKINSSVTCILNDIGERLGVIKKKKSLLGKRTRRDRHAQDSLIQQSLKAEEGAIIIFNGDCGFMDRSLDDVIEALEKYNSIFSKKNIHVFFIRGGEEDPSWFNGGKVLLSNIKCVEDYSLIVTKYVNVLCIGGGVPINKIWAEAKKNDDASLFEQSLPFYDEAKLSDTVSAHYPHVVMMPTQPTFISPYVASLSDSNWLKDKDGLIESIWKSRLVADKIYSFLINDCASLPFAWLYQANDKALSRYGITNSILFNPIPSSQIMNVALAIENHFCVDLDKLGKNSILPNKEDNDKIINTWYSPSDFTTHNIEFEAYHGNIMDIALNGQEEGDGEEIEE